MFPALFPLCHASSSSTSNMCGLSAISGRWGPRAQQPEQDPIEAILRNEIIPLRQRAPHIPAQIAGVIDRALATIERDRYQHAGEMYEALMHAFAQTD